MVTTSTIRPVRSDELARVADLTLAAYGGLGFDPGPYRASLVDVAGRATRAEVLVAVRDDHVVGAVTYVDGRDNTYAEFDDPDAAGIRMLAVDPGAQGCGIGAELVGACIDRAAHDGRRLIVLHSTIEMIAAQRLYRRLGFHRAPQRDWRPQPHVQLLGYVLAVDNAGAGRTVEP